MTGARVSKPTMKIAFILPGRGSSGGVRCISLIAQRLRDRGHVVRLLCRETPRMIRDWARVIQGKIFYRTAPDWIRQFKGPVEVFEDLSRFHFDPDEILVAVGMAECAQLECVNSTPNPKVQYLHGSTPLAPQQVDKALSLRYPKIVVASYLKDLVESRGYGTDVLAVVHNGVDPGEYFCSVPESQRDGWGRSTLRIRLKIPKTLLGCSINLPGLAQKLRSVFLVRTAGQRRFLSAAIGDIQRWRWPERFIRRA